MRAVLAIGLFAAFALAGFTLGGCGDDGGGFRAEELPAKADIDKKIQAIKDNASIPASAKPGILAGLEKQRERAK